MTPPAPPKHKQCTHCGRWRPIAEFRVRRYASGVVAYASPCRTCLTRREAERERFRARRPRPATIRHRCVTCGEWIGARQDYGVNHQGYYHLKPCTPGDRS